MEQRSEEWFKARLGRATASRFNDVMATLKSGGESASRKNYRAEIVLERLTGQSQDSYQNAAMQWGTDTEPVARVAYLLATGNIVEEVGFVDIEGLQAGASPDGLVGDNGVVEIKCPNPATHIATLKDQTVPKEYIAQIQGQLWATGRKWCDFVSFDPRMPEGAQLFVQRIPRDSLYIEELKYQVEMFLREVDIDMIFLQNYKATKTEGESNENTD